MREIRKINLTQNFNAFTVYECHVHCIWSGDLHPVSNVRDAEYSYWNLVSSSNINTTLVDSINTEKQWPKDTF